MEAEGDVESWASQCPGYNTNRRFMRRLATTEGEKRSCVQRPEFLKGAVR